ncbi:glutathione S-transferase family protein [Geminicoccus roseus]|uniref:glutathione S-transferase family protein n=1 Tax=Geminicoccus roseus TaxID=404900 RepID=UPI000413BA6C|nr:glutathione S-transferase family protein [Geminicoccus roseus]
MILIGQYDSPFVRRVAIALRLYGLDFEHRPWSVFGDAERIRAFNPLTRVPTLVLDGGEVLIETGAILDHLDELAGPGSALIARQGPERRHALKICALGNGLAEKAVSLIYERALHKEPSAGWIARCEGQVLGVLDRLESEAAGLGTPFWFGQAPGHADIAVACAWRFLADAHPGLSPGGALPRLAAHAARCEQLAVFQEIAQPFLPPA